MASRTSSECIKPENKDIITEKMVALRAERDRIRNEIDDTAILQKKAIASTKLVGRLVKLAGELRELWAVATLSEKKEFVSLMVDSISIHPKGKKAEIRLSQNYLETKENLPAKKAGSFLLDGRGDTAQSRRMPTPSVITVSLDLWKPRHTRLSGDYVYSRPSSIRACEAVPIEQIPPRIVLFYQIGISLCYAIVPFDYIVCRPHLQGFPF